VTRRSFVRNTNWPHATLAGFDWGARTACIVAALWPKRYSGLVSVSGYLIGSQEAGKLPQPPQAELQWWYQYYFATERGRAGYDKYRRDFAKLIWRTASTKWNFDDATFDRSAASFDNPDHVAIATKFTGTYSHRTIEGGIGHNLPQEAPEAFADAVREVAKAK
jgi:pimeloyl-ACP methyl ester carboxylesterase